MTACAARPVALSAVLLLAAALAACGGAEEPTGAMLFARHCASCHGPEGRGDGPAAAALSTPPADLTQLALDVPELMKRIDGSRTIRAHGTAAMPVWGAIFEDELIGEPHARRTALLQVGELAQHVHGLRQGAR
jgi:mono/diheme cytochrome c family protein